MGEEHQRELPHRLGRYRVLRRLGAGGMAEVFLAKARGAEGIEKVLVVKRVLPTFARSQRFVDMFTAEAQVAVRLNHPNVVQVYGFEREQDEFLLAMEFVDGLDLGRLVSAARRQGRRIPPPLAAYVCMEVAKGLDYAHRRRDEEGRELEIVHRDVSPQNILLSYDGVVKVADFGIAKARLVSEETGVIKGKFAYMSPEQASGERVDRRSDVYSLGVVLAELLMHRPMHQGHRGLEVLERVRRGEVTFPRDVDPTVPEQLDQIVRKALQLDPEDRHQSARSLASDLARYLHTLEEPVDATTLETFIQQVAPRRPTSPGGVAGGARLSTAPTLATDAVGRAAERRERRQVVVVTGVLRGAEPETLDEHARQMLEDIAFKAEGVLRWTGGPEDLRFRVLIGLGTPSVHDPLRAVSFALDVREALAGLAADSLRRQKVSLGIARGQVTLVRNAEGRLLRYEPHGQVFDVADELAARAEPGEVLVAGEVRRMVRRHYAFADEGSREVTLLGSHERKVRAHLLRGGRTRAERAAEAMGAASAEGLLGRQEELQSLLDAYRHAVESRRTQHVLVEGDLGMGKSALVAASLRAMQPPPRVLRAECVFGMEDVPYAACAELVREACEIPDGAEPAQVRERLREATAAWFPEDGERAASVLEGLQLLLAPRRGSGRTGRDETERGRLIVRALERMLLAIGRQGPTVVWVDALQWVDQPSLAFVRGMVQRPFDVPVLAVYVSRPGAEVEAALASVPRIPLGPLPAEAQRALLRRCFGGAEPSPDVERALLERAGGNPFFIAELAEALQDRGVVDIRREEAGRLRVVRRPGEPIALPTTLEGVVGARVTSLPEAERRALQWLAVAGPGMRPEELEEMAEQPLRSALDELLRRGLLAEDEEGRLSFSAGVVRQVAYEQADDRERRDMHQRVARYLRRQAGWRAAPGRIARHLEAAGQRLEAAEAHLEAAEGARRIHSNREALRFYAEALRLLPEDDPRRFDIHAQREEILRGLGHHAAQQRELEALLSLARRSGEPRRLALAHCRQARRALDMADGELAERHLRRAAQAAVQAGSVDLEVETLRLRAELEQLRGNMERALARCDDALQRLGTSDERLAARGSVLLQRAALLRLLGRAEEAIAPIVEALVVFRRLGMARSEALALNTLGIALASRGDYEDAIALIRASIQIDLRIGDRFHLGRKLSNVGQLYAELGDCDRALGFLRRALRVLEAFEDVQAHPDALCGLAEVLVERGELDEAAERLDEARRLAERAGDPYDLARERLVRAGMERARGDLERLVELAAEAVDEARRSGLLAFELQGLALRAEGLARQGQRRAAETLLGEVVDRLGHQGDIEQAERVYGALGRAARALGEGEVARRALALAAERLQARAGRLSSEPVRHRYLARPLLGAALEDRASTP